MRIEVLSIAGCPNRDVAIARIRTALDDERLTAEIDDVIVADAAAAEAIEFLGSPSIRVDGVDVHPASPVAEQFGLMCRTYPADRGSDIAPSTEMIRNALRRSSASDAATDEE